MKRSKRTLVRVICIVLTILMCASMVHVTAFAAVLEDDPVGENGPSSTAAYVAISDGFTWKYPYRVKTGAATVLDGAGSYDAETNTLTLNNLKGAAIEINKMGEDFKIKLTGQNVLTGGLSVWGDAWGGSANIIGDGTLTTNGITLNAETAPAVLDIGPDVRVSVPSGGIYIYDSASENPLRFSGKERSNGKAGHTRNTTPAIHPSWNLDSVSYGEELYYNPTKPYKDYKQYEDTEYFAVQRTNHPAATRARDKKTMKAVSFTLREVRHENNMYVWYSTITQIYIWEDSALYQKYRNDLSDLTIEAYDQNYRHITEESENENVWAIVNNLGDPLDQVDIVPQSADISFFPEMEAAELDKAMMGRFYTAKINAKSMNGGEITDFNITGSAASWLHVDSKGNLSGKPKEAGMYSFYATATETVNGQTLESIPMRYRILVEEPSNLLKFEAAVDDDAAHSIEFKSKDGSFTKTIDLGNTVIGEGKQVSMEGIPAGDYTLTFTATMNGATITYSNPTREFTLKEGENNTVSFNPGAATIVPDENSILLKINNFDRLKDYRIFLKINLNDGNNTTRFVTSPTQLFPDLLKGLSIKSYELCVYDDAYRNVKATDGDIQADGNTLTANAVSPDITEYTVSGVPDSIYSVTIKINGDNYFQYSPPDNSWETPNFKLATLTESDKLSASVGNANEAGFAEYDLSVTPSITVSGTEIQLSLKKLPYDGVLSGKVLGKDNEPLASASITCAQTVNGKTETYYAVSGNDGAYRFENLVSGYGATLSVTAEHYLELKKDVHSVGTDTVCDLKPPLSGYIDLTVDSPLINATISWNNKVLYNQNGTHFSLPIPADYNGKIIVYVRSDRLVDVAKDTVKVENGKGTLNLTTVRKGCINWSGYLPDGTFVGDYSGKKVIIQSDKETYNCNSFSAVSMWVDPGKYKVSFVENVENISYGHQELEVKSDETSYVTVALTGEPEKTVSGSMTAPNFASTGEIYKIEGVINEFDDLYGLNFFVDEKEWDSGIKGVVINGKSAGIDHTNVYKRDNHQIDWSFPLHFTVYCEQRATSATRQQTFYMRATKMDKANPEYYLLDAVTTAYSPDITLNTADAVGGIKSTGEKGYATYVPESVPCSGKTLANTEISIYDNDELSSRMTSDETGNYKGNILLKSSEPIHTIRADVTYEGKTYSAKSVCYYRPGGAVLKRLWMNDKEYKLGSRNTGYIVMPNVNSFSFIAAIDNPEQLDDITYSIDGADVTGKVFFQVNTVEGTRIFKAESNSTKTRWYTTPKQFANCYPTGIKVLYRSKAEDHSYADTFTDADGSEQGINIDLGVKRTSSESGDTYKGSFKPDKWMAAVLDGYNGEDPEAVSAKDDDEEKITPNKLYDAMVWKLNHGEGDGKFKSLTAEQAAAKVSNDKGEIRTYTDMPKWTVNDQNLHLRMVELQEKGYQSFSYLDEETGHKMYAFSGTFYYGKDAMPVPSLQIQKIYSGIVKIEDDPRMFSGGKMIGSTLEVKYICDVTAKKWYRTQTATMPAGVRSAIHTSGYQIPSKFEAPFSYKDTNVFPVSAQDDEAVGASVGSDLTKQGISFEIDFSRVSAKTYIDGATSIGGFAYGKMSKATYFRSADKMYVLNKQTDELMDLVDIGLDKAINKGKNTMYIGVSKESLGAAGVVYSVGKINEAVNKPENLNDVYDMIYNQIRDNIRYYGKIKSVAKYTEENGNGGIIGDFSLDKYSAERMLMKSKDMADAVVELQKAIENAGHQDEFTKTVTEQMGYLSLGASLCPGVGTEASLVIDSLSFIISAANDTRSSKVREAAEKLMDKYRDYLKEDQRVKDNIEESEERVKKHQSMGANIKTRSELAKEDLEKKRRKGGGGGGGAGGSTGGGEEGGGIESGGTPPDVDVSVSPAHDPSGRVYEAVPSNTIEGATVTLYKYQNESNPMSKWDDSGNLGQQNPLTSDSDGFYRWDVPAGEWYVTAEKDGYVSGSSQNDTAATVTHNGVNYLPVLPPQLDVNIPLVSYEAPKVEEISAKSDGVYITFSKYMDESTVIPDNFELLGEDGKPIGFTLAKMDSEQAPTNIRYNGDAPYYTRTVKLGTELALDKEFYVKISEKLTSYAGVAMLSAYSDAVYADEKRTLAAPVFSVEAGEVDKSTSVTISVPDGASVIYTTDGSEPSAENGKRAKNGTAVGINSDMTLKAIAVKADSNTSAVTEAEYKVKVYVDTSIEIEPDILVGDANGDGKIDVSDVTTVQKIAAELIDPTDVQKKAADTTGDGAITVMDATLIQKYIAEIIDHF